MLTARLFRKLLCCRASHSVFNKLYHREKTIFLTFDDGPNPIHSNLIMDILAQHSIKATFFIVGINAEINLDTAKRMVREGHILGNHTYTHKVLPEIPIAERILEIDKCQKVIEKLQDPDIRIFRPPQGLLNPMDSIYLLRNNYRTILWSIDSNDYLGSGHITPRLRHVTNSQKVVLFHDDSDCSINALRELIPYWLSKGYTFSLPECLNCG